MTTPLEDYCGTCNKVTPSKLIRHSTGDEFRCTVCGNQQEFLENDDDILDDDRDPNNPVDVDADTWGEIYSKMDDFEGHLDPRPLNGLLKMQVGSILIRDDGKEFKVIEYGFWSKITDGNTTDDVKFVWPSPDGDLFVGANSGHSYTLKNK